MAKRGPIAAKAALVVASLIFYSWWNVRYLPLLLFSMVINYLIGLKVSGKSNRAALLLGIGFNVLLLGYYKYYDFMVQNINNLTRTNIPLLHNELPLAISFFTFQQIAYLMDRYIGRLRTSRPLDYMLFVSFFPQLIAGPIVHYKEVIPQFEDKKSYKIDYRNIITGICLFSIGLFKKTALADGLTVWVSNGFNKPAALTPLEAWTAGLAFIFQLYFDFSGYTDMAIGSALLLNINLPANFNSPLRATSIQQFWQRWHITLTRFFRDYVYKYIRDTRYILPFGTKRNTIKRHLGTVLTFLLVGMWHGAGWTFILFGLLHGVALVINTLWRRRGIRLCSATGWSMTFVFVVITGIFFRAENLSIALIMIKKMFSFGALFNELLQEGVSFRNIVQYGHTGTMLSGYLLMCFFIIFFPVNTEDYRRKGVSSSMVVLTAVLFFISMLRLNMHREFIYFFF
jgi:D-alanyl-lipoteichoic acid acyltransferase DltB (MBOAT superfamily)